MLAMTLETANDMLNLKGSNSMDSRMADDEKT